MIEEALLLIADPVFSGRFYPQVAPQGVIRPYGTYQLIVGIPQNTLSDGVTAEQNVFQIDVVGETYLSARQTSKDLDDAITAAFEAGTLKGVRRSRRSLFEDAVKLHRFIYEYSFWS